MMGGRLAEEIFLNQMSTGAGSDIESATELSRKMVCEWGMSKLGPLTFGKKEEQIFLGRELAQHRDFSEETAREIDAEVRRFVNKGYENAKKCILDHKEALGRIAEALLDREVLDANELKLVIDGKQLPARVIPHKGEDVQQVLRPEPGRTPGIAPGKPSPA
jgi:cell division protease FtsH